MDVALWIVAGVLAAISLAAGMVKATQPYEQLSQDKNLAWTNDFSAGTVTLIGTLEVLAAFGLILPWALDIVPVLTPLAATGLALLHVGACATHARRKEWQVVPVNVVLSALAVFVAAGRF